MSSVDRKQGEAIVGLEKELKFTNQTIREVRKDQESAHVKMDHKLEQIALGVSDIKSGVRDNSKWIKDNDPKLEKVYNVYIVGKGIIYIAGILSTINFVGLLVWVISKLK